MYAMGQEVYYLIRLYPIYKDNANEVTSAPRGAIFDFWEFDNAFGNRSKSV